MADKSKLYDNPRSKAGDEPDKREPEPVGEEFEEEGEGDEGLAAKERNTLRKKHLAEWKAAKDLSPENMKKIQSRHSQERADLEFSQENETMPADPDSHAAEKIAGRDADRAGARE